MKYLVDIPDEIALQAKDMTRQKLAKAVNISDRKASFIKSVVSEGENHNPMFRRTGNGEIVGVIGDPHIPFVHPKYLAFCQETFELQGVTTVVCIGDVVDNHALSFFTPNPDAHSPKDELELTRERLKP